jgi:hypothetical protein
VTARAETIGAMEEFRRLELEGGRVAFQAAGGLCLAADNGQVSLRPGSRTGEPGTSYIESDLFPAHQRR